MRAAIRTDYRSVLFLLCAALALFSRAIVSHATALDIPPYLMKVTETSICVRWRTDSNTDSLLEYGLSYSNLSQQSYTSGTRTDHEECPTGLSAGTTYYYRVGATGEPLAGGDANHFFQTAPPSDTEEAIRIWFFSDTQLGLPSYDGPWPKIRASYQAFTAGNPADLMMCSGDCFGNSTTDAEIEYVLQTLEEISRQTVFYPVNGNHEVAGEANWKSLLTLPDSGPDGEVYYSFDYGPVHIVALHGYKTSYPITDDDPGPSSDQWDWLVADLAAMTADWLIVVNHYPPYSRSNFDSDTEANMIQIREEALEQLEDAGLDLFVGGHTHSYERSYFVNGHYGLAATFDADTHIVQAGPGECCGQQYTKTAGDPGAVYVTLFSFASSGGSGTFDHPAILKHSGKNFATVPADHNSMVVDIQGDLMDVHILRQDGWIMDAFQIRLE